MVDSISVFCKSIICTVIFITIISMIVPDGKSKKYINLILGVVVTITLINPILNFMNIDISEVLALEENNFKECQYDESLYSNILKEKYNDTLVNDIISRLKENGYSVSNINVEYDDNMYPQKLYMNIESEDGYIQPVKIEVSHTNTTTVSELTKNKIKNIIYSNYGISKDNIFIE